MKGTRTPRVANIEPKLKLWLSSPEAEGAFGDGRWRLLEAVQQHGSLRAAAGALGISYRKAWGDLRKAEQVLGVKLIEKRRGGKGGGGTRLTGDGKKWVAAYARFRSNVARAVAREFDALVGRITK